MRSSHADAGNVSDVLIDTSAWVEALRRGGEPGTRDTVREAMVDGRARLCELVVLELWNGARGTAEAAMLRRIEAELELLPMTAPVWQRAYALARACRSDGLTIPAIDIAIAACARHYGATLLHRDEHFDRMPRESR